MKGPRDKREKKPRRKATPTPGGKALERLHQFEQERGLEPTDVEHPTIDKQSDQQGGKPSN